MPFLHRLFFCLLFSNIFIAQILKSNESEPTFEKFELLPTEIQTKIIDIISNYKNLNDITKTLKNLSLTNEKYFRLINDYYIINYIIKNLTDRIPIKDWIYALFLGLPGSKKWINKQLSKDKLSKTTLEDALIKIAAWPEGFLMFARINKWKGLNTQDRAQLLDNALKTLLNLDIDITQALKAAFKNNNEEIIERLLNPPRFKNKQLCDIIKEE
ncbi:MAG: hypothetical protein WDZ41_04435 [Candidatus Babeliales bacterium]